MATKTSITPGDCVIRLRTLEAAENACRNRNRFRFARPGYLTVIVDGPDGLFWLMSIRQAIALDVPYSWTV